jgi:predicted RNA-binding protein (virulence factor B family)
VRPIHKKRLTALLPGHEYTLTAVRESSLGVFLDAGTGDTSDDILLHKSQQTTPVSLGAAVKVSLYIDPHGRLTASMRLPSFAEGEIGLASVLSLTGDGAFTDIGAERGVFLPFKEMRGKAQPGDVFWVKLYRDKQGRRAVSMLVDAEIDNKAVPAAESLRGANISGRVYNALPDGWLLFTAESYVAFLHKDELSGAAPAIGQEITGRVAFVRPDGRLNISQKERKEKALLPDAQRILDYLAVNDGKMPYGDSTPPETVRQQFGVSKAAFKRALGHLMKEGKVRQENGSTFLL